MIIVTENAGLIDMDRVASAEKEVVKTTHLNKPSACLGLQMGELNLLVSLTDMVEVLPVPSLQAVPLTKAWFLGVCSVRGNLYSVTDLSLFLGLFPTKNKESNRIVLLNSVKTTQAALLVDGVLGLRHVEKMQALEKSSIASVLPKESIFIVSAIFQDDQEKIWLMLDVDALARNSQFIQPGIA
jgi:twitching motility protein PilI